jgi:Holliday junction resolvase RusA-like endonuclease
MERMRLVLPWPPSVNHYKKVGAIIRTKNGKLYQKRVNTNETKLFYFQVWQQIKMGIALNRMDLPIDSTIDLGVDVYLYPPSERRYDADNRLKVLLDSLVNAKVIEDDSQITRLLVQKMSIISGGQTIVEIYAL